VTLDLQPRPWYNLGFRVRNEQGQFVAARIYLGGDFPQWLDLPAGTIDIEKPVGQYFPLIAPNADNQMPLWKHFWHDRDTVFEYIVPTGDLSWSENFEGGLDWTSGGTGNNWRLDVDTTSLNYGQTLHTNAAGFRTVYPNNSDTWISPGVINVSGGNSCALIFDRRGRMDMPSDSLIVEVQIDGNWIKAGGFSDIETGWTTSYVNLTPWTPLYIPIRFRLKSDHALGELGYHLDNFRILQGIDLDANDTPPATVPFEYKITSAYPNPFNPSTTVTYQVAAAGNVQFSLFNLLGQEVKQFDLNLPSAGAYTMQWDGTNAAGLPVPSGIYFLQLRAQDVVSNYKLVLMK
jgi:hypothetical protein